GTHRPRDPGNLKPLALPALVAQGIERRTPKPGVAGSNPAGGTPESIGIRRAIAFLRILIVEWFME
ncbi:MAG: hypothetical protein QOC66_3436, partial [Pseudonocardiales bacterium]|nr:hypothetical protein [Pseudonocardiales bacterium]